MRKTYKSNPQVNRPIMQKPMHKTPLRWHHTRVFLRLLRSLLLGGELGAWIQVARGSFDLLCAVRGGVESCWFLEDERFLGGLGGFVGGIANGEGGASPDASSLGEEEAWNCWYSGRHCVNSNVDVNVRD